MRIVLFSINFAPELTATGYYSGVLARDLVARGHQVVVFAAPPFYPEWKRQPGYSRFWWSSTEWEGVHVYRCPTFIPSHPSGITRLLHYGSFAASSLVASIWYRLRHAPDLVLNVSPTIFSSVGALALAALSSAKSWLHIQDFEVEAGFATGQMTAQSLLGRMAMRFERLVINSFDKCSSISHEMCRKLVEKGRSEESVYEFRNWSDLDTIKPQRDSIYRAQWSIGEQKVVLFSGSITRKQGLEVIVEAARLMQDREDLIFVLCGNGPGRAALERQAIGLSNLLFHDLQPRENLNELLALATLHLLPQKADAADLVLPSKLTNMLASGRPVIAGASPNTGLAREVKDCGLIFEPEDAVDLASKITELLKDETALNQYGLNARERARQYWHQTPIIDALESQITLLCADTPRSDVGRTEHR